MVEKIELFLQNFASCLQVVKIYTISHPKSKEILNQTYDSLRKAFGHSEEITIGIVGDELAFEKSIFFDLSARVKAILHFLKDHGIEKISFYANIEIQELESFVVFFVTPSDIGKDGNIDLTYLGIRNITVGKMTVDSKSKEEAQRGHVKKYDDFLERISKLMGSVLDEQEVDYMQLRFQMVNVFENLIRYGDFLKLTTVKKYDTITFSHLMNVSILAMYFSSRLGFARGSILDIGIAALFHDIGKIHISRKILSKESKLSEEEFQQIQNHSTLGAHLLLRYIDKLGILPVVVAFEHHIRHDTGGYPHLFFQQKPHIASKIVTICDVYDALIQRRSYKRDYPPPLIHEIMTRESGGFFDPELLEKFFKIMGVWPLGTIVELSDGRIAVIKEENESDIFSPKVEVVHPKDKREIIDLRKKKEITITRFLNPLGEGKEYLKE